MCCCSRPQSGCEVCVFTFYLFTLAPVAQIDKATLARLRKEKKDKALQDYAARMMAKKDEPETFTKKSLFRIVNNVQVRIDRLHVRYEDDGIGTGTRPFAFGITLLELSARSADENWAAVAMGTTPDQSRKVRLCGFN